MMALICPTESVNMALMNNEPITIADLERRLYDTERRIAALQERADRFRAAIDSLKSIEAMFADDDDASGHTKADTSVNNPALSASKLGPTRPEGIPSNFDMVRFILINAEKEGLPGLRAADLVAQIAKRYWPGLQGQQILPGIYNFAKTGRLIKGEDGRFRLPKTDETPREVGSPEGVSKLEEN